MNKWKKGAAGLVAIAVILQCVIGAVAANTGVVRRSSDRSTVLIDLFQNDGSTVDFVKEYPEHLYLNEAVSEMPTEPEERQVYDEVPVFAQEDYAEAKYGTGTVADQGSSITALAMAATYLTGYEYLPDELAYYFAAKADTDAERIQYASEALGLVGENVEKWDDIVAAVQNGKCAILQLNEKSLFAEDTHFIVMHGVTEEGKILINDPCGANYDIEELKEGYASGFAADSVKEALSWGFTLKLSEAAEDIKRYEEPVSEVPGDRYESLTLSPAEKQLLARAVCVLGAGECMEGQQVLAEVFLNRLLADGHPDELKELVYGKDKWCTPELLNGAEVTQREYAVVERAIYGPYILERKDITDFSYTCHK